MSIEIVPTPQEVSPKAGSLEARNLRLPDQCPFDADVMRELWTESGGAPSATAGRVVFREAGGLGPEEYGLGLGPESAEITYTRPNGAYYGFVTHCEWMKSGGGTLPCAEIADRPAMAFRAVTDDISRGQISTLENFKSIVRRLSLLKMNVYMPYIEDVFRFECEPEIGKYSDAVPPAEWTELIAYAKRHFVDVRPIFNTLGHWDKAGPTEKYRGLMIDPPPDSRHPAVQVLDPVNPAVRPLLAKLLGEIVGVFGEGLVHTGGDEPVHLTKAYGAERGAELYVEHYTWLRDELARLGCTMAMYADMFAPVWGSYALDIEATKKMPRDVRMVFWSYSPESEYSTLPPLLGAGFETFLSPATHNCCRLAPALFSCYENTRKQIAVAAGRGAGLMMSNWGDGIECARELAWAGYATAAEFAWAAGPTPFERLMQAFHRQFYGLGEDFDFSRIEPIYGTNKLLGLETYSDARHSLWAAFWRDAREPADEKLKPRAAAALAAIEAAQEALASLTPRYNQEAFACLEFGAKRTAFTARKLMASETGPYRTREQAKAAAPAIRGLAAELRGLLDEARTRWFASNRQSQWALAEARYLDLADSLDSLARYAEEQVHFGGGRKYLLEV